MGTDKNAIVDENFELDKLEEIEVVGKSLKQVQALEEDEIESEFKKEVEKLRLDMLKLMEILQKEEVTEIVEMDKAENIEIEMESEVVDQKLKMKPNVKKKTKKAKQQRE